MADTSEEGFTVRDRRRSALDEPAPAPLADSTSEPHPNALHSDESVVAGEFADDAEYAELPGEEGRIGELPDIYSVLALFLNELRQLAWLRMGLVANPGTGTIERDMAQARVAIDTVAFLATQLETVVSPDERLPLKALVSDLQINFVEQSKRG